MRHTPKTRLYDHQQEAVKFLAEHGFGALLMDPRTGKTAVAVNYANLLVAAGKIDRMVVIAPARVLDVWVGEFAKHSSIMPHIIVWDAKARASGLAPIRPGTFPLHVLIVNYDAFATRSADGKMAGGRRAVSLIKRWVDHKPCLGILDESHRIKTARSNTTKNVLDMRATFSHKVIMSGTPITKASRVFDLYTQWKFLHETRFHECSSATKFKERYGDWQRVSATNPHAKKIVRILNHDELMSRIQMDAYIKARSECFELPPPQEEIIKIPMDPHTREVYDNLKMHAIHTFQQSEGKAYQVRVQIALTLSTKLAQVAGGFVITEDKNVVPVSTAKLDELKAIINENAETDDKTVIVAKFRHELAAIKDMCRGLGIQVYEVSGRVAVSESTKGIKAFQESKDMCVMLVQPQAGEGYDLSAAGHLIFYSLDWSWKNHTQVKDRIALHAAGTKHTYLLMRGSVDFTMKRVLDEDGDVGRVMFQEFEQALAGELTA